MCLSSWAEETKTKKRKKTTNRSAVAAPPRTHSICFALSLALCCMRMLGAASLLQCLLPCEPNASPSLILPLSLSYTGRIQTRGISRSAWPTTPHHHSCCRHHPPKRHLSNTPCSAASSDNGQDVRHQAAALVALGIIVVRRLAAPPSLPQPPSSFPTPQVNMPPTSLSRLPAPHLLSKETVDYYNWRRCSIRETLWNP